jgi:hypothetical protein
LYSLFYVTENQRDDDGVLLRMAVDIVLTRQLRCPAFFLPTLPEDRIAWQEGTSEDLKKFKEWFEG